MTPNTSHAIMPYLINKYAPESDLYPKDPVKRASIDFMMHFDNGILDKAQRAYFVSSIPVLMIHGVAWFSSQLPVLRMGKDPDPEKEAPFKDALRLFDHFLSNRKFAAGDTLSIADISIVGNLQYAFAMDYDFRTGYDNIKRWWDLVTSPSVNPCYHEINDEPTKQFKEAVKAIKAKFAAAANQ